MTESEILVHDGATHRPQRLVADESIIASSADRNWCDIAVERQRLPPAESNGYMAGHLLGIHLAPPPFMHDRTGPRDHRIALRPGDVLLLPAEIHVHHAWDEPSEVVNVLLARDALSLEPVRHLGPDPVVAGLVAALVATLEREPAPADALFADGVRDALVAHVNARHGRRCTSTVRVLSHAELRRVDALIRADLTSDLSVAELAAVVPMSRSHFSRAFKTTTGLTPHAHVVRRRIDAAKALLIRSPVGLEEVARRTGFSDSSHLARQFRRHLGTSPAAFRRHRM